jgi:hypothetical protein
MGDQFRPPIVDPLDDTATDDDARREEAARRGLPEHEIDEDETVGGGVLAAGGTAIDRGTGTLGGTAESHDPTEDDDAPVTADEVLGRTDDRVGPDAEETGRG